MTAIALCEVTHLAFPEANWHIVPVKEVYIKSVHLLNALIRRVNRDRVEPLAPPIELVIRLIRVVCSHAVVDVFTVGTNLQADLVLCVTRQINT